MGLFADILDYPAPGVARKAAECAALIGAAQPEAAALLESFRGFAEKTPLGKLQEVYSGFFDLNSICHPYVGYQLFGENYKRSTFLVGLKKAYRDEGFEADASEIPDRLSMVLRFAAHSKGGEDIDELLGRGVLPALERMTTKPENDRLPTTERLMSTVIPASNARNSTTSKNASSSRARARAMRAANGRPGLPAGAGLAAITTLTRCRRKTRAPLPSGAPGAASFAAGLRESPATLPSRTRSYLDAER